MQTSALFVASIVLSGCSAASASVTYLTSTRTLEGPWSPDVTTSAMGPFEDSRSHTYVAPPPFDPGVAVAEAFQRSAYQSDRITYELTARVTDDIWEGGLGFFSTASTLTVRFQLSELTAYRLQGTVEPRFSWADARERLTHIDSGAVIFNHYWIGGGSTFPALTGLLAPGVYEFVTGAYAQSPIISGQWHESASLDRELIFIPAPSAVCLLAVGGLLSGRRRR